MVLQHTYEIYSRSIELSVHDNVLLVHHLDSSTVLLLDVRARTNGPIVGPLPLAVALENQVGDCCLLPVDCKTVQCFLAQCCDCALAQLQHHHISFHTQCHRVNVLTQES